MAYEDAYSRNRTAKPEIPLRGIWNWLGKMHSEQAADAKRQLENNPLAQGMSEGLSGGKPSPVAAGIPAPAAAGLAAADLLPPKVNKQAAGEAAEKNKAQDALYPALEANKMFPPAPAAASAADGAAQDKAEEEPNWLDKFAASLGKVKGAERPPFVAAPIISAAPVGNGGQGGSISGALAEEAKSRQAAPTYYDKFAAMFGGR